MTTIGHYSVGFPVFRLQFKLNTGSATLQCIFYMYYCETHSIFFHNTTKSLLNLTNANSLNSFSCHCRNFTPVTLLFITIPFPSCTVNILLIKALLSPWGLIYFQVLREGDLLESGGGGGGGGGLISNHIFSTNFTIIFYTLLYQ